MKSRNIKRKAIYMPTWAHTALKKYAKDHDVTMSVAVANIVSRAVLGEFAEQEGVPMSKVITKLMENER